MITYVVGFLFTHDAEHVILIKKNRPDWQKDKLNGVGGHVLEKETPAEAMSREFYEEAGVETKPEEWENTVILLDKPGRYCVYFFRMFSDICFGLASTQTDESIEKIFVSDLSKNDTIQNIRWLIPIQLDKGLIVPIVVLDRTLPGDGGGNMKGQDDVDEKCDGKEEAKGKEVEGKEEDEG